MEKSSGEGLGGEDGGGAAHCGATDEPLWEVIRGDDPLGLRVGNSQASVAHGSWLWMEEAAVEEIGGWVVEARGLVAGLVVELVAAG